MFAWTYLDGAGEEIGRSPSFPDADQAEEWFGATWPDLLERGVQTAELHDHAAGTNLYRMGLVPD